MTPRKNRQRHWPRRRGAVLALFAVLLFAMLPLMALVIDLGIARVTRRQMQTAANMAALEGLRHRDDPNCTEPGEKERKRREKARDVVGKIYEVGEDGQPRGQFKGYLVEGTGTILEGTNFRASPKIMTDDQGRPIIDRYSRDLELNEGNAAHGDMVAGEYIREADFHYEERSLDEPHYRRGDFKPGDNKTTAFLVRLRRVAGWNTGGIDNEEGVSSAGPPIPFLFGRGGIASGGTPDPAALWNQREEGTTLRVTAIADARRAWTVGPRIPQELYQNLPRAYLGLAPIAISERVWSEVMVDVPINLPFNTEPDEIGIVYGAARINSLSDSELKLSWAVGWPADPNDDASKSFRIRIGKEILRVIDMVDATPLNWKVERRLQGTATASSSATSVFLHEHCSVAEFLPRQFQGDIDGQWWIDKEQTDEDRAYEPDGVTNWMIPIYKDNPKFKIIGFAWAGVRRSANVDALEVIPINKSIAPHNATVCLLRPGSPDSVDLIGQVLAPALVQTLGRLPP